MAHKRSPERLKLETICFVFVALSNQKRSTQRPTWPEKYKQMPKTKRTQTRKSNPKKKEKDNSAIHTRKNVKAAKAANSTQKKAQRKKGPPQRSSENFKSKTLISLKNGLSIPCRLF